MGSSIQMRPLHPPAATYRVDLDNLRTTMLREEKKTIKKTLRSEALRSVFPLIVASLLRLPTIAYVR